MARARGLSDAFRRRAGRRHDGVLAGPSCRGFVHNALTGPRAAGAPRGARGRRDTTDTGAYVVTGFIDLAEQRRTCARAMMLSSALLAAWAVCGRRPRAAVLLSRSTTNFCPEDAELLTHGPSHVLAPRLNWRSFALHNRASSSCVERDSTAASVLSPAEGAPGEVSLFFVRKPGRTSVLQWR